MKQLRTGIAAAVIAGVSLTGLGTGVAWGDTGAKTSATPHVASVKRSTSTPKAPRRGPKSVRRHARRPHRHMQVKPGTKRTHKVVSHKR
jgi:hypothetical protein